MDATQKTFENFAAKRFCNNHTAVAQTEPLETPLLKFSSRLDINASRAISLSLFNFIEEEERQTGVYPHKSIFRDLVQGLQSGSKGNLFSPYSLAVESINDLDKIQLVSGLGILGPQLRDEIYCQICKHLNGNHRFVAQQKGWSMLAACLAIFPPSEEFKPYLENFMKKGSEKERSFCQQILKRTKQNGDRFEPISSTEYTAILKRQTFTKNVRLMNGQVVQCKFDFATKPLELRRQIKAVYGFVDLFGFSFRIHHGNMASKVVGGSDHVMDVVSACEQIAKEVNLETSWNIFFFKEIFSPWQSPSLDPKSAELIYNQVISNIKSREYKIDEENILCQIAARHCFILHGRAANHTNLEACVHFVIPDAVLKNQGNNRQLVEKVMAYYQALSGAVDSIRKKYVEELVNFAKYSLTSDFTRYFELMPETKDDPSILSVNWNNIRVFQKQSIGSWTLAFSEITKIAHEKLKDRRVGTVTIFTIHNDQKKLLSLKAEEMFHLLNFFLSGLRKRSKFLLAMRDHQSQAVRRGVLEYEKNDLIILKGACDGESLQATGRGYGVCQRTREAGEFIGGFFYIIPVLKTPSADLLAALRNGIVRDPRRFQTSESSKSHSNEFIQEEKNVPEERTTEKVREDKKIVLKSKEYDYIRYPMNNPTAPNIYDIMKPTLLEQKQSKFLYNHTVTQLQHEIDLSKKTIERYTKIKYVKSETEKSESPATVSQEHVQITSGTTIPVAVAEIETTPPIQQYEVQEIIAVITDSSDGNESLVSGNPNETNIDQLPAGNIRAFMTGEKANEPEITPEEEGEEEENGLAEVVEAETPGPKEATPQTTINYTLLKTSGSFNGSPSSTAIATYVTQPAGDILSELKLTDVIFGTRISKTNAEDNIYLMIMKNIQAEENELVVERSWELMWLATGLYPSSERIRDEVISFLRSRTDGNPLARQCYARFVKMITHQGRRTYPPHVAEVQAIQTRMDLIHHKVFFPDGSIQSFEVESTTTVRHLISVITENIGLKFKNGCGLFFKIGEKVFGAADEMFFFDFIQRFIEIWRKTGKDNSISVNYQLFFLRKVWINVVPGVDRVADCRLHYYQELSKYLRGYHQRSKEDSIKLAALVFRAEFGEDTDNLSEIPDTLNKLVPQDVISELSVDEWVKTLGEALANNAHCVGDDAKIEFLKELYKLETFGTAFFHAKPKEPEGFPEHLLIAVRRDGFVIMKDVKMTTIEKYSFNEIVWWSSGEHVFRIDVEKGSEKKRLEFHTTLDYQIEDFLTSYISISGSDNHIEGSITSEDER